MSLRSLQSLAFVPLSHVYTYFCILISTLEPTNELQKLIIYFSRTWIGTRHIFENEAHLHDNDEGNGGWK